MTFPRFLTRVGLALNLQTVSQGETPGSRAPTKRQQGRSSHKSALMSTMMTGNKKVKESEPNLTGEEHFRRQEGTKFEKTTTESTLYGTAGSTPAPIEWQSSRNPTSKQVTDVAAGAKVTFGACSDHLKIAPVRFMKRISRLQNLALGRREASLALCRREAALGRRRAILETTEK